MGSSLHYKTPQIANKDKVRKIKPFSGKAFVHRQSYRRVANRKRINQQVKASGSRRRAIPVKIVYKPHFQGLPEQHFSLPYTGKTEPKPMTTTGKAKILLLYAFVGASATILWDLLHTT